MTQNYQVGNDKSIIISVGDRFGNAVDSVQINNIGVIPAVIDSDVETFLLANKEVLFLEVAEFLEPSILPLVLQGDGIEPIPSGVDCQWKFELYKLQLAFRHSGRDFVMYRFHKNEYNEPSTEYSQVLSIRGLYHETIAPITESTDSAGIVRSTSVGSTKVPKILCKSEATAGLQQGDFTIINGKRFFVTGVSNIQEQNIIADISMRLQDDGVHVQF